MRSLRILCCCVVLSGVMAAQTVSPTAWEHDPQVESKIDALVKQMTLDEKIGQLVTYSAGAATGPGTGRTDYKEMIAKGQLGSLFNLTGAAETNAMQKIAVEKSRLHIPLIFGLDIIHGFRTEFPVPLGLVGHLGPGAGGADRAGRGQGSQPRRCALDVLAHGGHRARCPLGTHRRRRGRRSLPRLGHGRRLCARLSGREAERSRIRSPPAPSISSATARPKADATTTRRRFRCACCGKSICRRFRQRSMPAWPRS